MEPDKIDWIGKFLEHWPSLAWLIPVGFLAYYALKFIALSSETVTKLLGGLGTHWRDAAERKQKAVVGEIGLLRDEVRSLSGKIGNLQLRDDINWAYVRYDSEWHRRYELRAVAEGKNPIQHVTFLEFRTKWLKDHGLEDKEAEFWQ